MDALDDILDEAARQLSLRHTPWTPEEDARLAQLRREGQHPEEIAETLGMTTKGVEYHISQALKKLHANLKDYIPLLVFLSYMN
jgi:RNA polymerase sigma-70 factor (ECF subfamily)